MKIMIKPLGEIEVDKFGCERIEPYESEILHIKTNRNFDDILCFEFIDKEIMLEKDEIVSLIAHLQAFVDTGSLKIKE